MPSLTRRQARELIFQFLYSQFDDTKSLSISQLRSQFELFCKNFHQAPDEFTWEMVEGIAGKLSDLDKSIAQISANWRLERMPRVDLTILRLGCFEILNRSDIPKVVTINEAVELSKRFGTEESASFINGILDKLEKEKTSCP